MIAQRTTPPLRRTSISQTPLARIAEVSQPAVNRYLNSVRCPRISLTTPYSGVSRSFERRFKWHESVATRVCTSQMIHYAWELRLTAVSCQYRYSPAVGVKALTEGERRRFAENLSKLAQRYWDHGHRLFPEFQMC